MLQSIWDQLDEIFGPILRPILDPIILLFQDSSMRSLLLSTIIWSFLIIGGLVYLVYEGPALMHFISGSSSVPLTKKPATKSIPMTQQQMDNAKLHRTGAERIKKEGQERESRIHASGVRVSATIKKSRETNFLRVTVHNGSISKIDMVVVDINLPSGIDTAIGSFRMQRLGSIAAGDSESKDFVLNLQGGDLSQITGYVEFLGASYESSKIPLPAIEVES